MTDQKPKHILCAVRGGQESRNTVVRAIDLALEYDARLTFFHILDAEFLGAASLTSDSGAQHLPTAARNGRVHHADPV